MAEEESFEDLLNLILVIEADEDETDGPISVTVVIRKITQIIKVVIKIISQVINTFRSCTRGEEITLQAAHLTEITTTLVTLTDLLDQLRSHGVGSEGIRH